MNNLWMTLLIFIQPVLWLGILRNYIIYRKRIKRERNDFNTSISPNDFEMKHFWLSFIVLGIVGSIISMVLGIYLSLPWIIIYEALLLINLIIIPGQFFTVLNLLIATALTFVTYKFDLFTYINTEGINTSSTSLSNALLLLVTAFFVSALYMKMFLGNYQSPKIFKNQRGNKVAGYLNKEFAVLPIAVLIPGDQIHALISWWPVFSMGQHQFTIFILPVLIGIRFTIFKSMPKEFFKKLSNRLLWLTCLGIILVVATYLLNGVDNIELISMTVMAVLYLLVLIRTKRKDNKKSKWFSDAVNGLRVIAVRRDTPAEKMGVEMGDLIIEVNNIKVSTEDDFYKATLTSPTFCRLKVLNRQDRIKIMESAIYSDSPNELGVVVIKEK